MVYSHQEQQSSLSLPKSSVSFCLLPQRRSLLKLHRQLQYTLLYRTCPGFSSSSSTSPLQITLSPPWMHPMNLFCHCHKIQFCSWEEIWNSGNECEDWKPWVSSGTMWEIVWFSEEWDLKSSIQSMSLWIYSKDYNRYKTENSMNTEKKNGSLSPASTYACT